MSLSLSHGATFIFLLARKKVWMVVRIVIDKLILFEDLRFRSVEILSKKKKHLNLLVLLYPGWL